VSLTIHSLDGRVPDVATWSDTHSLSPSTSIETAVLACDPQTSIALVARYQATAFSALHCPAITPSMCATDTPTSASGAGGISLLSPGVPLGRSDGVDLPRRIA